MCMRWRPRCQDAWPADVQRPIAEFFQTELIGLILALFGMALLAAEVWWLITGGGGNLVMIPFIPLTGFTLFVVVNEIWRDWR